MDSPMKNHPLGLAARYNDAQAEEQGFEKTVELQGLAVKDLTYLSQQRALRMLGIAMPDKYGHMLGNKSKFEPVSVDAGDRMLMTMFASAELDGMLIGWRGHVISRHEAAYEQPTPQAAIDLIGHMLEDFSADTRKSILRSLR